MDLLALLIMAGTALVLFIIFIRFLLWVVRLGRKTHDAQYKRQFIHEHRLQEEALRDYKKGR